MPTAVPTDLVLALGLFYGTISASVDTSRIASFPAFADLSCCGARRARGGDEGAQGRVERHGHHARRLRKLHLLHRTGNAAVPTDGGESIQPGPGDTFGEIAPLLTGQRTATVAARTPMRLLLLSDQDFQRIRARVPEFEALMPESASSARGDKATEVRSPPSASGPFAQSNVKNALRRPTWPSRRTAEPPRRPLRSRGARGRGRPGRGVS